MDVYGLTLESCESLTWAIRQEPGLWNWNYGSNPDKRGDGQCCVIGICNRYFGPWEETFASWRVAEIKAAKIIHGSVEFAEGWFYSMSEAFNCQESLRSRINLRNLTLWKLRSIHAHLLSEAENHGRASGWTPPVIETVPNRELVPSRGE